MKIENQTELSKIIDLARKKGLKSLEIDGIKMEFLPEIPPSRYKKKQEDTEIVEEKVFTDDDILLWSAGGEILSG